MERLAENALPLRIVRQFREEIRWRMSIPLFFSAPSITTGSIESEIERAVSALMALSFYAFRAALFPFWLMAASTAYIRILLL